MACFKKKNIDQKRENIFLTEIQFLMQKEKQNQIKKVWY